MPRRSPARRSPFVTQPAELQRRHEHDSPCAARAGPEHAALLRGAPVPALPVTARSPRRGAAAVGAAARASAPAGRASAAARGRVRRCRPGCLRSLAAPPRVSEAELSRQVLADLQRQLDLMLEVRLREALAPALARAADALIRDARKELTAALRDAVARAVAQELARRRDD